MTPNKGRLGRRQAVQSSEASDGKTLPQFPDVSTYNLGYFAWQILGYI